MPASNRWRAHSLGLSDCRSMAAFSALVSRTRSVSVRLSRSYRGLSDDYVHGIIDHAIAYVDGQIHTNGLENFWSLLKRTLKGTYVSVDPEHLTRYLDEQVFRFNKRKLNDAARFVLVALQTIGKRLTYDQLTNPTANA